MTAKAEKEFPTEIMRRAARLNAVQAMYQRQETGQEPDALIREYLDYRAGMHYEGERMVPPDPILLSKIIKGVYGRMHDIHDLVKAQIKDEKELEPLLMAILLCGGYELLAHLDIDAPIIINDYLEIGHGFYEQGQVSLINGVLDGLSKNIR